MTNHFHCQRRAIEALGMQVSHQQAIVCYKGALSPTISG